MKMDTFSSAPAQFTQRSLREQDRQVQAHVQLWGVMFSFQLFPIVASFTLLFLGCIYSEELGQPAFITGPVFTSSRDHLYKKTKKREGNKIAYWVQKWVCSAFQSPLLAD